MIINNIEYEINKGKRKNIYLQIKNGKVIVKVPYYVTNKQIEEIVLDKNMEVQMSKNALKVSTHDVEEKIYKEVLKLVKK